MNDRDLLALMITNLGPEDVDAVPPEHVLLVLPAALARGGGYDVDADAIGLALAVTRRDVALVVRTAAPGRAGREVLARALDHPDDVVPVVFVGGRVTGVFLPRTRPIGGVRFTAPGGAA